jgi:phosphatidylinositol alpha-1,6-mannosyltransferase
VSVATAADTEYLDPAVTREAVEPGPPTGFPRTLVLTGHYPPDHGGVERFTDELVQRLPPDRIVVMAPSTPGDAVVDALRPFPVIRYNGRVTTNPRLGRQVRAAIRTHGCSAVWITSGVPLASLAGTARRAGAQRVVVSTHGLESGWASLPGVRRVMRRASRAADVVTVLGSYTGEAIAAGVSPRVGVRKLAGSVDTARFRPGVDATEVLAAHDLAGRPVVITVGRLVPRKGQDTLLRAWPEVLRRHPTAVAVIVGEGYHGRQLRRLAEQLGVRDSVRFAGAVRDDLLPGYFAAADVYTLPCRTQLGGMLVEGLGLTTLEASAAGLPVVVGNSGGAADAVRDGVTGHIIDTSRAVPDAGAAALAEALIGLLDDPDRAARMGDEGRTWTVNGWSWRTTADDLTELLCRSPLPAP